MAFLITKTGSSLPWWSLCTRAVLLLFEEIPVAHTGFPIHIPEGFLKGTQSPSSKFQRRTACPPSQTVCSGDTLRPVLISHDVPGPKQNNRMAPDQTTFSFKAQTWIPQRQWKAPHLQHLCGLQGQRHQNLHRSVTDMLSYRSSWVKAQLQSWGWWAETGHFGAAPVVGVKLPVPYVSLGPLRFIDQVQLLKKAPSASLVHSD